MTTEDAQAAEKVALTDAADRLAIRQTLVTEWRDDYSVLSLVNALAVTVARIKAEAVERERATWAAKVEALADDFAHGNCMNAGSWHAARVRALLAADDTEAKP